MPAVEPREAASLLKRWALEAGFDRAGIAHLAPVERASALAAWLTRGDQAGMGWMAHKPEVRSEPERVLPGALSALCVALQYAPRLDPEGEREILEVMVRDGPLVDGVTGKQTATVDGLTWDEYAKPIVRIREILAS